MFNLRASFIANFIALFSRFYALVSSPSAALFVSSVIGLNFHFFHLGAYSIANHEASLRFLTRFILDQGKRVIIKGNMMGLDASPIMLTTFE